MANLYGGINLNLGRDLAITSNPSSGPSQFGNVVGWYKADTLGLTNGAAVNSWQDSSGLGKTMTAPASVPLFATNQQNGLPAVHFRQSSGDYMQNNGFSFAGGYTFVHVLNVVAGNAGNGGVITGADIGGGSDYVTGFTDYVSNTGATGIATDSRVALLPSTPLNTWQISAYSLSSSGAVLGYVNGVSTFSSNIGSLTASGTFSHIYLAARFASGSLNTFTQLYVGECILYNQPLNATNLLGVSALLNSKWAVY
jgi:hypothetical protein